MNFTIAVFSPPQAPSSRRALRFCEAVLASEHEISRLFFYQDGVHNASRAVIAPQDELAVSTEWAAFIRQNSLDAVVCIAAALRRGTLDANEAQRHGRPGADTVEAPWVLSGLGQLHEACQGTDRLVCFGGA